MPSELGQEFNDVARYPYMAVASPSCHDTTTTRSWWEEDAGRRERFLAEELRLQVGPQSAVPSGEACSDVASTPMMRKGRFG